MDPLIFRPVPKPPWFEERRRMIVWDDLGHSDVKEYLGRYWEHQVQYRLASARWIEGELSAMTEFPKVCFIPGRRQRPIAHMETNMA